MNERSKSLLIGAFVVAAVILVIWVLMFIRPSVGNGGTILQVRFSSIEKVSVGTRVTFAGKPVGEVRNIKEIYEARNQPSDPLGRVYFYELTLAVDSSVHVYSSDEIILSTSGLLGEKSIAIIPKASAEGAPRLVTNEVLYARSADPVEETMRNLASVSSKIALTMDHVIQLIDTNKLELHESIQTFHQMVKSLDITIKYANNIDLLGSLQHAATNLGSAAQKVGSQLDQWEKQQLATKIGALTENRSAITGALNKPQALSEIIDNVHTLTGQMNAIWEKTDHTLSDFAVTSAAVREVMDKFNLLLEKTADGKSTIGKLFGNDNLYLQMATVFDKVNTLMNDINNYGLLFHSDRGWQRMRLKRIAMLNELATPQGFRDYLNNEFDEITTSLGRISTAIGKIADQPTTSSTLLKDPKFTKEFSNLIRNVEQMGELLNGYNQKLHDQE